MQTIHDSYQQHVLSLAHKGRDIMRDTCTVLYTGGRSNVALSRRTVPQSARKVRAAGWLPTSRIVHTSLSLAQPRSRLASRQR